MRRNEFAFHRFDPYRLSCSFDGSQEEASVRYIDQRTPTNHLFPPNQASRQLTHRHTLTDRRVMR